MAGTGELALDCGEKDKNAEFLKKILESEAQMMFQRNMQYLGKFQSNLYNQFKNFTPKKFNLYVDEEGYLNLSDDGVPVYARNPRNISKEQYELFCRAPGVVASTYVDEKTAVEELRFIQCRYMNRIFHEIEEYRERGSEYRKLPHYLTSVVVFSVALGYHLEHLVHDRDIKSLFIFEPEPEVFYWSLYTVDWGKIFGAFYKKDYSIDLLIGGTPEKVCNDYVKNLVYLGVYRLSRIYMYKAADSEKLDETKKLLVKNIPRLAQGWGFFEDEVISIAHTVGNFTQKRRWLKRNKDLTKFRDIPVLLVGSGPSLDNDIEFIRANADKAIVVACGTSLTVLGKAGIKSDFYIHVERTYRSYETVRDNMDDAYNPEFLKETVLLANNTVPPRIFECFDRGAIAMKMNDTGGMLTSSHYFIEEEDMLDWGKPTCVNGGFSFMSMLGFQDIYLVGCDWGYKSKEKHHSELSDYYTDGKDNKKYYHGEKREFETEGNFGGKVMTSDYLDSGRLALEQGLTAFSHVNGYNLSDGTLCVGFVPTRSADVDLGDVVLDKESLKDDILTNHFEEVQLAVDEIRETYIKQRDRLHHMIDKITGAIENVPEDVSVKEAMQLLMDQDKVITLSLNKKSGMALRMLNGTLKTVQTMLSMQAQMLEENDQFALYFRRCCKHVVDFFERMKEITADDIPPLDAYSWQDKWREEEAREEMAQRKAGTE